MLESLEDFFVLESRGPRSDGSDPRVEGFRDYKGDQKGDGEERDQWDGDEGV